MVKTRETWREKLENSPKGDKRFSGRRVLVPHGGVVLVVTPHLVDDLIRKIQRGKLVTIRQLRERLAQDFEEAGSAIGLLLRIVAEAVEEDLRMGKSEITPYWRVVGDGGSLNEKFPGGIATQAAHLRQEGHTIEPGKGKKPPKVKDFEKVLVKV